MYLRKALVFFYLRSLVLENITEEESWIGQENSLDSLRAHFKCPLCKKLMKTEIFQCVDGHIWCDTCAESVKVDESFNGYILPDFTPPCL